MSQKPGYDVWVKNDGIEYWISQVTGCRCMSCEDFNIYWDDEDGKSYKSPCYLVEPRDEVISRYHQLIDALCKRVQSLTAELQTRLDAEKTDSE